MSKSGRLTALVLYLLAGFWFGSWQDAMDNYYGVCPGVPRSWFTISVGAVFWPVVVPFELWTVATGGRGMYVRLGDGCKEAY